MRIGMKRFREALKVLLKKLKTRRYRSFSTITSSIKGTRYKLVVESLMISLYYDHRFITYIFLDHNDDSPDGEEAYLNHIMDRLICDKK